MVSTDVVFTAYNKDRGHTYTLFEGTPDTVGMAHIVKRRPNMATRVVAIKYAVENADIAFSDKDHEDRERIYCEGADPTRPSMHMSVVVKYNTATEGTILTAWPTDKISSGGGDITYVKRKY